MEKSKIQKNWKIIWLLVLSFACAACVSTQSVVNRFGQKWVGQNFDDFVLRYGMPYRKFELNNGSIAYVWNSGISSVSMPVTATTNIYGNTAYTQIHGGGSIRTYCEVQLITDQTGVIRQVNILKDTIGLWATSRCHEVLKK